MTTKGSTRIAVLCFTLLAGASGAYAQDFSSTQIVVSENNPQNATPWFTDDLPHVRTFYGDGLATPGELTAAFGKRTFSLVSCKNGYLTQDRAVRVDVQWAGRYHFGRIVDAVLVEAANYAYQACPLPFTSFTGERMHGLRYHISSVDVYAADGTRLISVGRLCCDFGNEVNRNYYSWQNVHDFGAEARPQAAAPQQRNETDESVRSFIRQIPAIIAFAKQWWPTAAVLFVLYILFRNRESIARAYYFAFYPHPAAPMVRRALRSGAVLDGRALARTLGDIPQSRVLGRVRIEQGERLVALMQDASRARARQFRRHAAKDYERAALLTIEEAIGLAAVALEKAKALLRASESVGR